MQRKNYKTPTSFPDASRLCIGIVVAEFNRDITEHMLMGALATLKKCKVKDGAITVSRVPGSFEIPFGCLRLLKKKKYDAIIALGCIIKGETSHDVYIASAVSRGIMTLSLEHMVPIIFGVITTNTLRQAIVRSTGEANKGREAALAAVAMAGVK